MGHGTGDWANATNDLQGAIDACVAGDTVWVSNGVYQTGGRPYGDSALTNRVVINKAITVRSLSDDPADTIIKGNKGSDRLGNGPEAIRSVYIDVDAHASLIGFTVTNGATLSMIGAEKPGTDQGGGGICSGSSLRLTGISNCIVVGNSGSGRGGGVYRATLYNSVIANNVGQDRGDGAYTYRAGGGVFISELSNCLLTGNSGSYGSAAAGSTLRNCLIISNQTTYATYNNSLYNCLLVNNQSSYASRSDTLHNCTVANNEGYGLYRASKATNCIVYFNKAGNYNDLYDSMAYSCTTPPQDDWVTGDGNITNEPSFVNMAAGDYRLNRNSPCIDAGTNGDWTTDGVDLDGLPRIDKVTGIVDMGCYEYEFPIRGTIWTIR